MRLLLFIMLFGSKVLNAQERMPSDQHFWQSVETTARSSEIWSVWTEVSTWKQWDIGLQDAEMTDPFKMGARGTITSLQNRKSRFVIVDCKEGQSYTYRVKLPLGGLYVKRSLASRSGMTIFTHEVWFKGLTKNFFANRLGSQFRQMLPEVMLNIKNKVERNDGT